MLVVGMVVTVLLQRRIRNHVMDAACWVGDEVANYCCHIMSLCNVYP
jgi:hypothetical protein